MAALKMGHLEVVKLLLAHPKVDVNVQDTVNTLFSGFHLFFAINYPVFR